MRWDLTKPLTLENCVVFEFAEAEKHAQECLSIGSHLEREAKEVWGNEVQTIVDRKAAEVAYYRQWVGLSGWP